MKKLGLFVLGLFSGALLLTLAAQAGSKGERSITGTVVDSYCAVTMNMGGPKHKGCAAACVKNGSPIAIEDEKTGALYLTASAKGMGFAKAPLEQYLEQRVTVKGTVHEEKGMKYILVSSVSPAK